MRQLVSLNFLIYKMHMLMLIVFTIVKIPQDAIHKALLTNDHIGCIINVTGFQRWPLMNHSAQDSPPLVWPPLP